MHSERHRFPPVQSLSWLITCISSVLAPACSQVSSSELVRIKLSWCKEAQNQHWLQQGTGLFLSPVTVHMSVVAVLLKLEGHRPLQPEDSALLSTPSWLKMRHYYVPFQPAGKVFLRTHQEDVHFPSTRGPHVTRHCSSAQKRHYLLGRASAQLNFHLYKGQREETVRDRQQAVFISCERKWH